MTTELKSMFGGNLAEQSKIPDPTLLADKQNKEAEEKKRKEFLKKQSKSISSNLFSWNEKRTHQTYRRCPNNRFH